MKKLKTKIKNKILGPSSKLKTSSNSKAKTRLNHHFHKYRNRISFRKFFSHFHLRSPHNLFGQLRHFSRKIHKKISDNQLLNNPFFTRFIIIAFFLGLNLVLGIYFIKNNKVHLPGQIVDVIRESGLVDQKQMSFLEEEKAEDVKASLKPQVILELLNKERVSFEVNELIYNESLASAAAILMDEAKKNNYDLEDTNFLEELKNALNEVNYNYLHVSHNIVIGPMLEQAVVDAWFSDKQQVEALKDDDFVEVGFASRVDSLEGIGNVGIVVQVLGKPMESTSVSIPKKIVPTKVSYPEVSDQEVFDALNSYRNSHGVEKLNINDNLCSYASKRVGDLVAFGGLDDHAGFKNDLADQDNLPDAIKYYSGNSVAENLAFQHCKNMQTGDSFVASTGTALIEWCFDSSTEGHREAQLSKEYKNVCVRHAESMYVIIFGN